MFQDVFEVVTSVGFGSGVLFTLGFWLCIKASYRIGYDNGREDGLKKGISFRNGRISDDLR